VINSDRDLSFSQTFLLQELAEELVEMPFEELQQFKKTEGITDFKQKIKASARPLLASSTNNY